MGGTAGGIIIGVAVGFVVAIMLQYFRRRRRRPNIGGVRQSALQHGATPQIVLSQLGSNNGSTLVLASSCEVDKVYFEASSGAGCSRPPPDYKMCVLENREADEKR